MFFTDKNQYKISAMKLILEHELSSNFRAYHNPIVKVSN
jgi:hypothetical protein